MNDGDFRKWWLIVIAVATVLVFSPFLIFGVGMVIGFLTHLREPKLIYVERSAHVSPAPSTPPAAP